MRIYFHEHSDPGFMHMVLRRWNPGQLVGHPLLTNPPSPLPQQSDSDPYVVFIPYLTDAGDRWNPEANPIHSLPGYVIDDLNARRTRLVVDYSNEGGTTIGVDVITGSLRHRGVTELANVTLVAQDRQLVDASERDSSGIRVLPFDTFLVLTAMTLRELLDDSTEAMLRDAVTNPGPNKKFLLCLNATPRFHRLMAVAQVENIGLLPDSLLSLPGLTYAKSEFLSYDEIVLRMRGGNFAFLEESLERVLALAPLTVDEREETGNALAFVVDPAAYANTWLSLVTETGVDNQVTRITEKTFKAAALGHPFMMYNHPNTLPLVESFGFSTFPELVDSSYDSINDASQRLIAIGNELQRLRSVFAEPEVWARNYVAEQGAANRHWLMTGFLDRYFQQYVEPILDVLRAP